MASVMPRSTGSLHGPAIRSAWMTKIRGLGPNSGAHGDGMNGM